MVTKLRPSIGIVLSHRTRARESGGGRRNGNQLVRPQGKGLGEENSTFDSIVALEIQDDVSSRQRQHWGNGRIGGNVLGSRSW